MTDLDLVCGSQGQTQSKAKHVGFIFLHIFHLIRAKFNAVVKQLKLNILSRGFSKIYWNKGNNCCFTHCIKKLSHWHAFRCLWMDLIQTQYDDRYYCTLHFDTSLIDLYLDLDSRSQDCEKANNFFTNYLKSVQSIWMEFSVLLRLVGVMNLIFI